VFNAKKQQYVIILSKEDHKLKKLFKKTLVIIGSVATFEVLRRNGVIDQVAGKIKQAVGEATDNRKMQAEGKFDQARGKAKKFFNEARTATKESMEGLNDE
jgi:uncharacterized protein YjbJ (UPF0337 family)